MPYAVLLLGRGSIVCFDRDRMRIYLLKESRRAVRGGSGKGEVITRELRLRSPPFADA